MNRVLLVVALTALVGCWQEVHFDPSTEAPAQTPAVFAKSSRATTGSTRKQPSGSNDRYDSSTKAVETEVVPTVATPAAQPDQSNAEPPEPVWNEPSAAGQASAGSPKPAPPAELDWLEEEPKTVPAETRPAIPLAAAWQLGSKWSLAIGIYGKGYGADRYGSVVSKAEQAAELLDIHVPAVPSEVEQPLPLAIEVLRTTDGPRLVEALGQSHSSQHEALCQLAIVTHALLLDYSANGSANDQISNEIRNLATAAELPEHLWLPAIEALADRSEFADVKQAVLKLHRETAKYLESF